MRILMVGCDGKGSFEMRGRQLGHALGARVTNNPFPRDWSWADVIVLVKRAAMTFGTQAKKRGVPVIWDVVDAWQQPEENQAPISELRGKFRWIAETMGIRTVVGATEAMARDLGGVYLPHHARLSLSPEAPRLDDTRPLVVAYEGQPKYLGPWRKALEIACADLGFEFVVNPDDIRRADALVALRGGRWDGEVCRQWKSGVKYVNALVAGRPILTQFTAGFQDVQPEGVVVEHAEHLVERLQTLTSRHHRLAAYQMAIRRAEEFSLSVIARRYREIITQTVMRAAA